MIGICFIVTFILLAVGVSILMIAYLEGWEPSSLRDYHIDFECKNNIWVATVSVGRVIKTQHSTWYKPDNQYGQLWTESTGKFNKELGRRIQAAWEAHRLYLKSCQLEQGE